MTRFITLTSFLCLLAIAPKAQTIVDASHLKQLVTKNASALNFSKADLENYRIANAYYDETAEATMAYLQQTYKGIEVYNAITAVAFKNDKLISVQSSKIEDAATKAKGAASKPAITPAAALSAAVRNLNLNLLRPVLMRSHSDDGQEFEYDNLGIALNDITVRLMWTPVQDEKKLQLTWQVSLLTLKGNDSWQLHVNALSGQIVRKDNLTSKCDWAIAIHQPKRNVYCYPVESFDNAKATSVDNANTAAGVTGLESVDSAKYNVIAYPFQDPNYAAPSLQTNPWTINGNPKAYTKKWDSDNIMDYKDSLKGNNIFAYTDRNSNNKPDFSPPSQTPLPDLTWNYLVDFNADPTEDPSFGIVNLFYWTNLMHDMSYDYGFDEAAGNMQTANFSRGGKQKDLVLAEAMDGADTSNANFAPTVDGKQSRLQEFLWRQSILKVLKFNSPLSFKGSKPASESNVSNNNKIAQKGIITSDVVLYKDILHPTDSSTACGGAANAAQISGKIAYIDRGSCPFTQKFHNAQTAGAKAIIVGNVAPNDPRYDGTNTGNFLVIMSATPLDNTITIPGVFIQYDTATKLKNNLINNIVSNATLTPTPMIDGDVDNTIATHEYTHGISNRLTGGAQTVSCLNNGEQPGEGWSDYFALMMTTNWKTAKVSDSSKPRTIGNYAAGLDTTYGGIRIYPYSKLFSIDPWTYDSLRLDTSIHEYNANTNPGAIYYTGELWCSTLWDMTWNLIKTEGINKTFFKATVAGGNTTAMKLVIQGMKLQKCSPGCIDARNAILDADTLLYGGSHGSEIWKAFARRGMGYSATQGSNQKIKDGMGAYNLPPGVTNPKSNKVIADKLPDAFKQTLAQVSPNPTKDHVTITIPGNTAQLNVQLLSNTGAVLGNYTLNGASLNIDVSKLSAGIYNILITGENLSSKYKLVVQ